MPEIMIFDDEQDVRESLALYSEMLGYDATAAKEPHFCPAYRSNQACDKQEPCADILLIDQFMPTMFGMDWVERQANKECKIPGHCKGILAKVFVEDDFKRAEKLGCHVLQKPVTYEILENRLVSIKVE
jgi:CheY-like chemotaxis protein